MTKEEAIKNLLRIRKHYQYIIPCEKTIAIDMAIVALQKSIPKPPKKDKEDNLLCPLCGENVDWHKYCEECGQAIEW